VGYGINTKYFSLKRYYILKAGRLCSLFFVDAIKTER